jgi:hypothetical protein
MQAYLGFSELRGCSDFFFVPGTRDCHIFLMRTEETLQNVIRFSIYLLYWFERTKTDARETAPMPLLLMISRAPF